MKFVEIPNLPRGRVSLAVVDCRLAAEGCRTLEAMGTEVLKAGCCPDVYPEISCHPDIMLHHVGGRRLVYAPGTDENLLTGLERKGFELIRGSSVLQRAYPFNIAYNVARVGDLAFHNLKYTDPVLVGELSSAGVELVHVNQGYAKCAVSVVDSRSIITADRGIARTAVRKGMDVLLLDADQNIDLFGMEGFIGGVSGMVGPNLWAVSGSFEKLKSFEAIKNFLSRKSIDILSLGQGSVVDIGTIIPLAEAG